MLTSSECETLSTSALSLSTIVVHMNVLTAACTARGKSNQVLREIGNDCQ